MYRKKTIETVYDQIFGCTGNECKKRSVLWTALLLIKEYVNTINIMGCWKTKRKSFNAH